MDYTQAFWERAWELVDGPKQCQKCKMWQHLKTRPQIVVRLVLEGDGKPIPSRLRMLCATCSPAPRELRLTAKQIRSKIAAFPFMDEPEAQPTAEGDSDVSESVKTNRGSR